jgi:hypothetical protein
MNPAELIERVLTHIHGQFYCDLKERDFFRDRADLIAAIATFAHECNVRDWQFDATFIYREISTILTSFKHSGTEIKWMPIYLQDAIRRHIGEHAEELNELAKSNRGSATGAARLVHGLVGKLRPVQIVEPTAVEVSAKLYHDIRAIRRKRAAAVRAVKTESRRQKTLF